MSAQPVGGTTKYAITSLSLNFFAKELSRRFAGTKKTSNAVHPGVIHTNLTRHSGLVSAAFTVAGPLALKNVEQGAATQVFVATHPSLADVSGEYFSHCNVARARRDSDDRTLAKKLWETSERIVSEL